MDGTGYENWCAKQLKKYGYHHIRTTRKTGDQGIDLIAEYRGRTYGFQCKYYSSPVGNDAVQQAYAGLTYYGLDEAGVITNTVFTASADALAKETGVFLWENMDPERSEKPLRLLRIGALVCTVYAAAVCVKTYLAMPDSAALSITVIAALSDFIFACGLKRYGAVIAAAVLGIFFLVSAWIIGLQNTLFLCVQAAALAVMMIRAAVLKKEIAQSRYMEEKAQLIRMIGESEQQLAELTAQLLSQELGCALSVRGIKRMKDGSRRIQMHAQRNVGDDVAVAVYSLNRYGEFHHLRLCFSAQVKDARSFTVTVAQL